MPQRVLRGMALAATVAAVAAGASATTARSGAAALEPQTLVRARLIGDQVTARYRRVPGRRLVVSETTSTGVVDSFTLVDDWVEPPRVVPATNGIYYAICPARAVCPYPARSASWGRAALLPRRQAVELALRTFLETSADLVVVSLPSAEPTWLVFERTDVLASVDARSAQARLTSDAAGTDAPSTELVRALTGERVFVPLPLLPPPDDTIYAVRLGA